MKRLFGLLALAAITVLAAPARGADDTARLDSRLEAATNVIQQIMSVPDKAIPEAISRNAVCVGVIPGMVKGAFVFGAKYGQGVVTCRTAKGWSAPVFIRIAGGSWGLQAGGQSTDLVLVAMNQRGFQDLLRSKFRIGAGASAAAGPVGRNAEASTDITMRAQLLTWSRSRGAFAGINLNGATVSQNQSDTNAIYGGNHSFDKILEGSVPPTASAQPFLQTMEQYFGPGKTSR